MRLHELISDNEREFIGEVFCNLPEADDLDENLLKKMAAIAAAGSVAASSGDIPNAGWIPLDPTEISTQDDDDDGEYIKTSNNNNHEMSNNSENHRYLALTMWGEARSHGEDGMRAVGHVIVNRMRLSKKSNRAARRYGSGSIKEIVRRPLQFSCWNDNDPNKHQMRNIDDLPVGTPNHTAWETAQRIAWEILRGESVDPTNGAVLYHTSAVNPRWARHQDIVRVATVNNHIFYVDHSLPQL
jgi:spore germination cell wall hydrolase CwlJ-like protein